MNKFDDMFVISPVVRNEDTNAVKIGNKSDYRDAPLLLLLLM
jgi:hypothetical protein